MTQIANSHNEILQTDLVCDHKSFLKKVLALSAEELGQDTTDKWISTLGVFSLSESEVVFSAPSKFVRDWVIREFIETKSKKKSLKLLASKIMPKLKKVAIIHVPNVEEEIIKSDKVAAISSSEKKVVNLSKYDNVFALGTDLNPRYTFDNFVSVKYNRLAVSMARIAAGIDEQQQLFDDKIPLFIHGGVGVGKTHLAQAIAWQIKNTNNKQKVVYLSAERFMCHFVNSIRNNDIISFKEKMRSIDCLIVDDVQFIAGKESTQQEFMNCFNSLVEENKQVVLVCDRRPSDLSNIDEKLKSRISGGMILNFKNPDYSDRLEILRAKSAMKEQDIAEPVISLLAEKVKSSVRDLDGALNKLIAAKVLLEEEITIDSAKAVISEYIGKNSYSQEITISKVQKIVSQFYGITTSDIISSSRQRSVSRPRQIAMYLAKNMTRESLPEIGRKFGGKNHATVIHSVKQIEKIIETDSKLMSEVKNLEERINNS